MSDVTLVITSCSRFDLLERTLDSFFEMNTHALHHIIAHNDGAPFSARIIQKYSDSIEFIASNPRLGYSRSLDKLLDLVETPFVFTTEDDWHYFQNPGFIERSKQIMEAHSEISQVWIRDPEDFGHPLGEIEIKAGHQVRRVIPGYRKVWNGFSLNPGLRRMSSLKKMFPSGLAEYGDEAVLAERTKQFDYKAVCLVESSIKHLGWHRRSINFRA
jgi:hypothetical protein